MYTITKDQKERLGRLASIMRQSQNNSSQMMDTFMELNEILSSLPTKAQPTAGEVQEAIEFVEYMFQGAAWNEGPTHKAVKKIIKAAQSNAEAVELGERCEHCGTLRTDWQNYERSLQRQVEHQVAERLAQSRDDAAGLVVTSYAIEGEERYNIELRISNGQKKWCVKHADEVLNKKGKWEYEPMPSGRTEYFIQNTRFDTPQAAMQAFRENKLEECECGHYAVFFGKNEYDVDGEGRKWCRKCSSKRPQNEHGELL